MKFPASVLALSLLLLPLTSALADPTADTSSSPGPAPEIARQTPSTLLQPSPRLCLLEGHGLSRRADPRAPAGPRPKQKSLGECVRSGDRLLKEIAAQKGRPARFTDFDALEKAGYDIFDPSKREVNAVLTPALEGLGLPTDGNWLKVYMINRQQRPNRNGHFNVFYRYDKGAIVMIEEFVATALPDTVPKQINDLIWLTWAHYASTYAPEPSAPDLGRLKHFLLLNINNFNTKAIVAALLEDNAIEELEGWPGSVFAMDSDAGKALLGTPNGVALGWLLVYNAGAFKGLTVKSVNVFADGAGGTSMSFNVGGL